MLIANMVGYNEADRYLVDVLTHLKDQVDLIVFTDDCSTDDTPNIAEAMGAKVASTYKQMFTENEGALRQGSWANLQQYASPGDWILAIDCDERFYGPHVRGLMDQSRYDVLGVRFYHMWNDTHYRVDKAWKPDISPRLFRFYENGEFAQRKMACGSSPTYVQELIRQRKFNVDTNLKMQHLGYIRDEDKIAKHQRYMELDGGAFHARSHIESILDPNPILKKWTP